MFEISRDEILGRLKSLDEDAGLMFDDTEHFKLIIVGGGALILQEYISRATHDIDVISVSAPLRELLARYDINCQVLAFLDTFSNDYESRAELILKGDKVDFFTAALEDIVIAKLHAMRDTDKLDIEAEAILSRLDWKLLDTLAKSVEESSLNERRYSEFKYYYDDYVRRFRPCGT